MTSNKEKKTPGVDKALWNTPAQKMQGVLSLTDKDYKASPLRRVFIEKKGKKAKRPLGIPTMYDRAMQALYALALDPVSEVTADKHSFGFPKGRCAQDACEYAFAQLCKKVAPEWVLEGDIKGCFDNISHDWLIENIPMDKSVLKQFLKAGFVFKGDLFPTDDRTPQGGVISPILANMALDGLEKVLSNRFHTNRLGKVQANLFFQLISTLYENTSVVITSNKGFDGWADIIGDSVLTTALLDRLTHCCQVLSPVKGGEWHTGDLSSRKISSDWVGNFVGQKAGISD